MDDAIRRILIIKPSSLGDIVAGLAVIPPLVRRFPGARIDWVVGQKYRDLLLDVPGIGRLLTFDRESWKKPGSWPKGLRNFFRLVREARKGGYDVAIDLQGLLRSAAIAFLSGARIRIGFSNGREFSTLFYNRKVSVPREAVHSVGRYLLAPKELGAETDDVSFPIEIDPEVLGRVRSVLAKEGARQPVVVLNPTARWATKRWLLERYAEIGDHVRGVLNGSAVIIGGEEERGVAGRVADMMKGECIDLSGGLDLRELAALLSEADALVTNDTGPMHLAAALGTPVVAVFGPTDPARTGPLGVHRVIKAAIPCSPCFSRRCARKELECMESISASEVAAALDSILKDSE